MVGSISDPATMEQKIDSTRCVRFKAIKNSSAAAAIPRQQQFDASITVNNNIAHDNFWAGVSPQGKLQRHRQRQHRSYNNSYGIIGNNITVSGNIAYNNSQ